MNEFCEVEYRTGHMCSLGDEYCVTLQVADDVFELIDRNAIYK